MRVHLVLSDSPVSPRELRRCASSLTWRFGPMEIVHHDPGFHATGLPDDDQLVFIEHTPGGTRAKQAQEQVGRRTYYFDFSNTFHRAKLIPWNGIYTREDCPTLDAHAFSRLSLTTPDTAPNALAQLYPFPHTYLSRCLGLGPIDRFGFRAHPAAGSLAGRAPSHQLVCVFGGSSTWSLECLPEETCAAVLERRLNGWSAAADSGLTFTVLNFGIHGTLTMDHLLLYLYFAERLSPDVVISNDGVNDLWFGHLNDPCVVREVGLLYHEVWEDVARHASGSTNPRTVDLPPDRQPFPRDITAAYVTRKSQFRRVVEGRGTKFVSGLQPIVANKKAHSQVEQASLAHPGWGPNLDVVRVLYNELPKTPGFATLMEGGLDSPSAFEQLDGSDTHFVDIYHLSPEGEEALGSAYFEVLKEHFAAVERAS